ncbi:hydroxyisourate hydrolase [Paenibacillus sp. PL2-23]|uniref:hydroxyisourate hydrolase n=1 Tax=Paenibacillus sp. PL2-23 TaxID=2100729 RepID=UPI0030F78859
MGKITTHVLDTALGQTAKGLALRLYREEADGGARLLSSAVTNADGRLDRPLLEGDLLEAGRYEIRFHVGDYFRSREQSPPSIWDVVPVAFQVSDAEQHYHIPLLIAPGAYSTYRGS